MSQAQEAAAQDLESPPTPVDPAFHRSRYGTGIQMADSTGQLYYKSGYDSNQFRCEHAARIVRLIDQYQPPRSRPLRVLEVGAASGFLLADLRSHYPMASVLGIDPSPIACNQARDFHGVEVRCGTLETVELPNTPPFDLIVMLGNLMLHTNPLRSLGILRRLVASDGLLIFDTKNPRSTPRQLAQLAARIPIPSSSDRDRLLSHSFHGVRHGISKRWLRASLPRVGWGISGLETHGPRLLTYPNSHRYSRSLYRSPWRLLDLIDQARGQRAWIEVVATPI